MALHNLNINCNLIFVADDTSVSISEPSNKTLFKSLNLVILNVHEWFTNNRLILNIDKTKVLPYKDANIINSISINSTEIYLVSGYTFLGVILDNNIKKPELFTNIFTYILKLLYNSLFLPHSMYCLEM